MAEEAEPPVTDPLLAPAEELPAAFALSADDSASEDALLVEVKGILCTRDGPGLDAALEVRRAAQPARTLRRRPAPLPSRPSRSHAQMCVSR